MKNWEGELIARDLVSVNGGSPFRVLYISKNKRVHFNWGWTRDYRASELSGGVTRPELAVGMWVRVAKGWSAPSPKRIGEISDNRIFFDADYFDVEGIAEGNAGSTPHKTKYVPIADPDSPKTMPRYLQQKQQKEQPVADFTWKEHDLCYLAGRGTDLFVVTDAGMGKPRGDMKVRAFVGTRAYQNVGEGILTRPVTKKGMWMRHSGGAPEICRVALPVSLDGLLNFDKRKIHRDHHDDQFGTWTGKDAQWAPVSIRRWTTNSEFKDPDLEQGRIEGALERIKAQDLEFKARHEQVQKLLAEERTKLLQHRKAHALEGAKQRELIAKERDRAHDAEQIIGRHNEARIEAEMELKRKSDFALKAKCDFEHRIGVLCMEVATIQDKYDAKALAVGVLHDSVFMRDKKIKELEASVNTHLKVSLESEIRLADTLKAVEQLKLDHAIEIERLAQRTSTIRM